VDSFISATALVHGLTVATRNSSDFEKAGVKIVNPFPGRRCGARPSGVRTRDYFAGFQVKPRLSRPADE
jgi:hypothetical protein